MPEILVGRSYKDGANGKPCGATFTSVSITIPAGGDPSNHENFGRIKATVTQLVLAFALASTFSVNGNGTWPGFSAQMDANGNFAIEYNGAYAGFTPVRMRFTGKVTPAADGTTGGLDGTLEVGILGELPGGQQTTYRVVATK